MCRYKKTILIIALTILCIWVGSELVGVEVCKASEKSYTKEKLIHNESEFKAAMEEGNEDTLYKLANDIDLISWNTKTLGLETCMKGILDGAGYTINFGKNSLKCGTLIGTNEGLIKNLKVCYNDLKNQEKFLYSICETNRGTIKSCYVSGKLSATYLGMVRDNFGIVSDCTSDMDIVAFHGVAIVDFNMGLVENCNVFGSISTYYISKGQELIDGWKMAGVCFQNNPPGRIVNCTNNAVIKSNIAAGICLYNRGELNNCKNYGDILAVDSKKGADSANGVVYEDYGDYIDCENYGQVKVVASVSELDKISFNNIKNETPIPTLVPMPTKTPDVSLSPSQPIETLHPTETPQPIETSYPTEMPLEILPYIQNIKLSYTEENYAKLEWEKDLKLVYQVWRSKNRQKGYRLINTTYNSVFTDKKVQAGNIYYYKIIPVADNHITGSMQEAEVIKASIGWLRKPVITVKKGKSGQTLFLEIKLKKYSGDYAEIEMCEMKNKAQKGKFQAIPLKRKTINYYKGIYRLRYKAKGKKIYIRVRTNKLIKSKKRYSPYSKPVFIKT